MEWLMNKIIDYFTPFFARLFAFLRETLTGLWETIKGYLVDFLFALFDVSLTVFETIVTLIPVPSSWSTVNPMDSLPAQTLYVLYEIGILQALAIILSAWLIRWAINLIPAAFTRI
ncbi:MAG: DUF2523 domain-containing protein [Desulfuromonadales bacterium]|nr:DUF2523 domain-containing protein [Desulfuromonadales bacterium]